MKDLKLKVGDKCYIGREEWICCSVSDSLSVDYPYRLKRGRTEATITRDGRHIAIFPPTVSLEPYDFPEMVYEKHLEIGKPHYFWDGGLTCVHYGILDRIDRSKNFPFISRGFGYENCSPTPPELPIK